MTVRDYLARLDEVKADLFASVPVRHRVVRRLTPRVGLAFRAMGGPTTFIVDDVTPHCIRFHARGEQRGARRLSHALWERYDKEAVDA